MMSILLTALLSLNLFTQAEAPDVEMPAPTPVERLQSVYDRLYSIDYRKLEIEDFKTYSEVLREIGNIKDDVEALLNQNPNQNTIRVEVYEESFEFSRNWNNNCADYQERLNRWEDRIDANGIRACYQAGAIDCKVKIEGRLKSLVDVGQGSDGWPVCRADFDVVIEQTFSN